MRATDVEQLVAGLDHPEGVAYDATTGALYAGGELGQLYRVDLAARRAEEVARAPGFALGLAVDARGRVVVCCSERGVHVWEGDAFRAVLTDLAFANSPAFGPDGTLYVSDSGRWSRDDGRIVRIDGDGRAETLTDATPHFTNGLAVSPDARWLWVAESYSPLVSRVDLASGVVEVVVRLDGTVPDGLAFTADGGVVVTCYRPDRIYHLDRDGALEIVAEDPQGTLLAAPTNACFVGDGLDRLVSANLGRWHLTIMDAHLRGAPLHAPERWAVD